MSKFLPSFSTFTTSNLQRGVEDITGGLGEGGFEGQFRNVLGGEQLFDTSRLLSTGGRAQAVFNPRSGNLFDHIIVGSGQGFRILISLEMAVFYDHNLVFNRYLGRLGNRKEVSERRKH